MIDTLLSPLASIGAALCPIPAGGKSPVGIIQSFAHDWSKDPLQWAKWAEENPGCSWIMIAGPSQKVIVDIDVKRIGREAAWGRWVEWCQGNGCEVYQPTCQTPSGGWHVYFEAPEKEELRQPPLVPGVIDVRAGNGFVLVPPSQGYVWLR